MESGKQQIIHYFIEEAKEHLETIEKGLLDLRSVMEDPERVNELFRAAHSVKGGAAMLGFGSIQKTAHRLEDSFKVLQEYPINVDQKLVSLFLKSYDTLQVLIERLQGPYGLRDEEADKLVQDAEPTFVKMQEYIDHLLAGGESEAVDDTLGGSGQTAVVNLPTQVHGILKQMLQLFKGQDTTASRQQLQGLCNQLAQLDAQTATWQGLVKTTQKAIANSDNTYRTLAPLAIKEIKIASEQLPTGQVSTIAPSPYLQRLADARPGQKQILLLVEPQSAAKALTQAFNQQQLSQLVQLLQKAAR